MEFAFAAQRDSCAWRRQWAPRNGTAAKGRQFLLESANRVRAVTVRMTNGGE
jgi:hypothetical protein